jgi:ADP-ribosyl-[dinitrogen reductase] hydrolase
MDALVRYLSEHLVPLSVDDLRDRYRGALLGLCVGNALGIGIEGWTRADLAARQIPGLLEIGPEGQAEPWDDDVAQAVILAEAMIERGQLQLDDLANRLVHWGGTNGRGMGILTAKVLAELIGGTDPREASRIIWERTNGSAGNGAVMRCAPIALRWLNDPVRMIEDAKTSALVTHFDPRSVYSTIAVTALCAFCLSDHELQTDRFADALGSAGAPEELLDAITWCPSDIDGLILDDWAMGYTLKAMQVALVAARWKGSFEDFLVQVMTRAGDTDTNGAVAGAVLGCKLRAEAIPKHWLSAAPGTDRLQEIADQLLAATLGKDLPVLT